MHIARAMTKKRIEAHKLIGMLSDLSGLHARKIILRPIGDEGDFEITIDGTSTPAQRKNVDAICERLRGAYVLR